MFRAAGLRPYGVTITGGDRVVREDAYHAKVPKRELVGLLVALFQSDRLKVARDLELAPLLLNELLNFRLRVNVQSGHDSYEAWRESIHDDLVLATALACWRAAQHCNAGVIFGTPKMGGPVDVPLEMRRGRGANNPQAPSRDPFDLLRRL